MKKSKETRINITATEYESKMEKVIKKGKPVAETLIEMLEVASKYEIKDVQP